MKPSMTHSLRGRLLWFLLAAIVVTAGVQAVIAYRTALTETDEIFDYQMQQMAMSLRPGFPLGSEMPEFAANDEDNFDFIVQVWASNGSRVFQSTVHADLPQRAVLGFSNVEARGTNYRIFSLASGPQVIQVAQDLSVRRQMAGTLALRTVSPMILMVPLLMLIVWWVVSASLAPVAKVRKQVALRQADDLSEVSEVGLPDEVFPLVRELNLLFVRLRHAFDAQKAFVADASHELRSPLAALKLQVQGLKRAADETSRSIAIERLNSGIDRATRLIEQLLLLARQQARPDEAYEKKPLDLAQVAQVEVADLYASANEKHIDLGITTSEPSPVTGNVDAVRILVRNLVDNAIKYSPVGGTVNVAIRCTGGQTFLTVEDSGAGIAEDHRNRLFDRFFRLPGSKGIGSGLGLAIVKAVADLHGAEISFSSSDELGGLKVSVAFGRNHGSAEQISSSAPSHTEETSVG
jgi:two-component system OmpR family sensor kinase